MSFSFIYNLAIADFKERSRRYSYLVLIGLNLFLAYVVFVDKFTINFGKYKGMPNSAWTGSSIALTSTVMLVLFGFYVVKNCIKRDSESGVGQILAATKISNFSYLTSKYLSNVMVLGSMVVITVIMTVIMQLTISSQYGIELGKLTSPFLIIMTPLVFIISAIAILFESVRWLRGGFGNVLFYILSMSCLPIAMESSIEWLDLWGLQIYEPSMYAALKQQFPEAKKHFELSPGYFPNLTMFVWNGIVWSKSMILNKIIPMVSILPVMFLANIAFDRFSKEYRNSKGFFNSVMKKLSMESAFEHGFIGVLNENITKIFSISSFTNIMMLEIKLLTNGITPIWYLVAIGLGIAQIVSPFEISKHYLYTASIIWPLLIWSKLGFRDIKYGTVEMLSCTPISPLKQLTASWVAGIIFTMIITSGLLIGSLIRMETSFITTWLIVTLFIPTLALTFGVLTGSNKLFEIVYLSIWYLGPLNMFPYTDFTGITEYSQTHNIPFVFLMITILLVIPMYLGKIFRSKL